MKSHQEDQQQEHWIPQEENHLDFGDLWLPPFVRGHNHSICFQHFIYYINHVLQLLCHCMGMLRDNRSVRLVDRYTITGAVSCRKGQSKSQELIYVCFFFVNSTFLKITSNNNEMLTFNNQNWKMVTIS